MAGYGSRQVKGGPGDVTFYPRRERDTQWGIPQNGWIVMDNLIKMDDVGENFFLAHLHIVYIYSGHRPPRNPQFED